MLQVSFVNSINTIRGGKHVDAISDQIVQYLIEKVKKKAGKASASTIRPVQIRNHLWVFVNALIVNPAFDSQTKESLNTRPSDFGSQYKLSEDFMKKGESLLRCIMFRPVCKRRIAVSVHIRRTAQSERGWKGDFSFKD